MPESMLLSDDSPIFPRSMLDASHRTAEKAGMEGSAWDFLSLACLVPQKDHGSQTGEANRPMTANLPEIEWIEKRKNCSDCNKPTHLSWKRLCSNLQGRIVHPEQPHNKWWLCQGCARRRGGSYQQAIEQFLRVSV